MEKFYQKFEKIVTLVLLLVAVCVVTIQTLELIWELGISVFNRISEVGLNYAPEYNSQAIVVLFFSILLTLEIMETVKINRRDHQTKIEVILIVCMIAISRKILEIDSMGDSHGEGIIIAALIFAFAASYFLIRKSINTKMNSENQAEMNSK